MQYSSSFIRLSGPIPEVKKSELINDYEKDAYWENLSKAKHRETNVVCSKYIGALRVGATSEQFCCLYFFKLGNSIPSPLTKKL